MYKITEASCCTQCSNVGTKLCCSNLTKCFQLGRSGGVLKGVYFKALLVVKVKQNKTKNLSVTVGCFHLHMAEIPFGKREQHGGGVGVCSLTLTERRRTMGGCNSFCVLSVLYLQVATSPSSSSFKKNVIFSEFSSCASAKT